MGRSPILPRKDAPPSKGDLILKLVAAAQALGRTPTADDIRELSSKRRIPSLETYRAVFGRFSIALERARLKQPLDIEVERKKLLAEIRALRKKLGRPLIQKDILEASKK